MDGFYGGYALVGLMLLVGVIFVTVAFTAYPERSNASDKMAADFTGDFLSRTASLSAFVLAASAASRTAGPTLRAVEELTDMSAKGSVVSPSSNMIRSGGSPSVSDATWAMTVYVPVPRSCVPLWATARPLARIRTRAMAGKLALE